MEQKKIQMVIQEILLGDLFTREFVRKQYKLLIMIVVLLLLWINNGYKGNSQRQKIQQLQLELTEARYEMLDLSATYTEMTRASSISKQLKEMNSKVKESTQPPIRIQ